MNPSISNTPHVIIMVGIPGAGKTTFAESFAKTFKSPYINPRAIADVAGIDDEATEKITELVFGELLKTNRTLIYEGSTFTKAQRTALELLVKKSGYRSLIVWVQTDPAESKRRATRTHANGAHLTGDQFDALVEQFQNPLAAEKPVVISGKHTYTTQLKTVLKRLAGVQPNTVQAPEKPRSSPGRNITVR